MELNKKNTSRILLICAFSITLYAVFQNFSSVCDAVTKVLSYFTPFAIGAFIALIANVLLVPVEHAFFSRWEKSSSNLLKKLKRPLSLIIMCLLVLAIFALIVFIIAPEIKNTAILIAKNFPSWFNECYDAIIKFLDKYNISAELFRSINIDWQKLSEHIFDFIKNRSSIIVNTTVNFTSTLITGIFNFILGVVFSFYVLLQKEKLASQAKKIMLALLSKKRVDDIIEAGQVSSKVFSNFIRGQTIEACIIGILCFIGMKLFHMPYAPMISALIGVTALIPVFGAFLGTGVGAFLIVMVNPMKAFWFIVFIIILQQLEGDLIYPKVVGTSVGLPGIWVLVAATVGGSAGGIFGLFISVPISAALYSLAQIYITRRLKAKGIENSQWMVKTNKPQPSRILNLIKKFSEMLKAKLSQSKSTNK